MEHLFNIAGSEHAVKIETISNEKYTAELNDETINFASVSCFKIKT